jgi:hypothetical protein
MKAEHEDLTTDDVITMGLVPIGGGNITSYGDALRIRALARQRPTLIRTTPPTGGRSRGVADAEPYFWARLTRAGRTLMRRVGA